MESRLFNIKNYSGFGISLGGFVSLLFLIIFNVSCSVTGEETIPTPEPEEEEGPIVQEVEGVDYFLPNIDLNNWKVTLPIGNPTEVEPPEILDYATNEMLQEFMYNDSTDGSLVFYTYPGSSTRNSSYSRTELREQMVPGSNTTNWTFAQGGRMKGTLKLDTISVDADNKPHRTIIMQIHGRLTNTQRDLIGEDDNNAPPMLKIYWNNGRVRVKTKILKDLNASDKDILYTSAWGDDDGYFFSKRVDHNKFTLEVIVSEGRMEIVLDDEESVVYDDIHIEKWGVFENYFKAGNYLVTTEEDAFSKVKYYDLEVSH
ncbi:MAG: polysaccharide lyase family 7 protein [Bacteroidota bacterium]